MGNRKEQQRQWRIANPAKVKEYSRRHRAKRNKEREKALAKARRLANPEKAAAWARATMFRKRYGITVAQYDLMFILQGGVCAICASPPNAGPRKCLAVDHNHTTGALRGLLCTQCNSLIGLSHENVGVLGKTITYLEAHR